MSLNDLITVIVPIYNTKEYLERCVQSVLSQTHRHIQLVLVDDGSTDGSEVLCDKYAEMYKNIEVIHQNNQGVSVARNQGILRAKGEAICFVDSDDFIDEDAIETMYTNMEQYNADISVVNMRKVFSDKVNTMSEVKEVHVYSKKEALEDYLLMQSLTVSPCAKLIRKNLYKNVFFDANLCIAEDKKYNFDLLCLADVVCFEDVEKYNYYMRDGSATKAKVSEKHANAVWGIKKIREEIENNHPELSVHAQVFYGGECINYLYKYYQSDSVVSNHMRETEKECLAFLKNTEHISYFRKHYQRVIKMLRVSKYVYFFYVKIVCLIRRFTGMNF